MEKLEDENLLSKINDLMKQCGFNANGVYVIDASKRDKRLNDYFGGLLLYLCEQNVQVRALKLLEALFRLRLLKVCQKAPLFCF